MQQLKQIEKGSETILKRGRKIYATVSFNKNPDYKWVLFLKTGMALTGYDSKELAINRANKMNNDFIETLNNLR